MTHQSGIPVTQELRDAFAAVRNDPNTRALKCEIKNEKIVPSEKLSKSSDHKADFKNLQNIVVLKQPCYIAYKLDDDEGYIFVNFAPDNSSIKDRMLYASTRDTCKKGLGYSYFTGDFHTTEPNELTWENYEEHKQGKYVDAPLTLAEQEIRQEKFAEIAKGTVTEYVHSVKFPVSKDAFSKLQELSQGSAAFNSVLLTVDTDKETIELLGAKQTDINSLPSILPVDQPCFVIFRYSHQWNSKQFDSNVFVYSCPMKAKIKSKMLHSTVKAPAIEGVGLAGVKIEKKVEVTDSEDLDAELLNSVLHPEKREVVKKATFSRPTRPGRGPRKITRRTNRK